MAERKVAPPSGQAPPVQPTKPAEPCRHTELIWTCLCVAYVVDSAPDCGAGVCDVCEFEVDCHCELASSPAPSLAGASLAVSMEMHARASGGEGAMIGEEAAEEAEAEAEV